MVAFFATEYAEWRREGKLQSAYFKNKWTTTLSKHAEIDEIVAMLF